MKTYYNHNYYRKHSKYFIKYAKSYHHQHYSKQQLHKLAHDNYQRHHDTYLNNAKQWKRSHPLRVKQNNHKYYLAHKHEFNQYQRNRRHHKNNQS